jgi:Restriction endonuclease NaeI
MDHETANDRVAELFRRSAQSGEVVTREQILHAAGSQLDPLKRVRRNGGARDILDREGIEVVWLGGSRWRGKFYDRQ